MTQDERDARAALERPERDARAALEQLDLPQHEILAWLDDDLAFCREHGGGRRYAELIAMLERFRSAQISRERGE